MNWDLDSDRPIYAQLVEHITRAIISGAYQAGDKLPSVRDFAQDAAVNPNTMQKALAELERTQLVFSKRTSGRYITEDTQIINAIRTALITEQINNFFAQMQCMGCSKEETIKKIIEEAN